LRLSFLAASQGRRISRLSFLKPSAPYILKKNIKKVGVNITNSNASAA